MDSIGFILKNDIKGFHDFIEKTDATICGKNPILFLMNILRGQSGILLKYTNSGEMTGDFAHSVSYASIIF